jgi:hypothetical protein
MMRLRKQLESSLFMKERGPARFRVIDFQNPQAQCSTSVGLGFFYAHRFPTFLWRFPAMHVGHKNTLAFHRINTEWTLHHNESSLLITGRLNLAGEGVKRLSMGVWQHVKLLALGVVQVARKRDSCSVFGYNAVARLESGRFHGE